MASFNLTMNVLKETVRTTQCKLLGDPGSPITVGSQMEGSTTIGMDSDTDHVFSLANYQVVQKLDAWKTGKVNMLAFKDETTPPQFYKLCRLQPTPDGRQEYMRDPVHETDVVDEQGRVLVCNTTFDNDIKRTYAGLCEGEVVKNGPARSWSDEFDNVDAILAMTSQRSVSLALQGLALVTGLNQRLWNMLDNVQRGVLHSTWTSTQSVK